MLLIGWYVFSASVLFVDDSNFVLGFQFTGISVDWASTVPVKKINKWNENKLQINSCEVVWRNGSIRV